MITDLDSRHNLITILQLAYSVDHEHYFRSRVLSHRLGRRLPLWPQPLPKETIRLSHENESGKSELEAQLPPGAEPITRTI